MLKEKKTFLKTEVKTSHRREGPAHFSIVRNRLNNGLTLQLEAIMESSIIRVNNLSSELTTSFFLSRVSRW